jgi:transcription initiation factor TFIID subunit 8
LCVSHPRGRPRYSQGRHTLLVIQDLHRKIHDYANLANRTAPLASDMFEISQECGLDTEGLRLISELSKLRRRGARWKWLCHLPSKRGLYKGSTAVTELVTLLPAGRRSPPPKLLSSDDEGSPPTIPSTLRSIPHFYPNLPPKHTYLWTPVRVHPTFGNFVFFIAFATAIPTKEAGVAVIRKET